ncbi:MAG: hypothetical protein WC725_04865 [Patescibacteria group bacterium]
MVKKKTTTPQNFEYLGMLVKPYKKLTGIDADFARKVSRASRSATPPGWNYDEFYKTAKAHNCGDFDLFEVDGKLRIAGKPCFFVYE